MSKECKGHDTYLGRCRGRHWWLEENGYLELLVVIYPVVVEEDQLWTLTIPFFKIWGLNISIEVR